MLYTGLYVTSFRQGHFLKKTKLLLLSFQDYQTYSFNLLVKNDFAGQILDCPIIDGICSCPIPSSLTPTQCALSGEDVVRVSLPLSLPTLATYVSDPLTLSSLIEP